MRVNETLTLLFDDDVDAFESQDYAFYVDDPEFDTVLQRVQANWAALWQCPWSIDDGELNDWNGSRGFYFKDRDGHIIELMTCLSSAQANVEARTFLGAPSWAMLVARAM